MHPCPLPPARLAAQLARTEEAAKRALVKGDSSARGGVAQRLLDAERQLQAAREEVADLGSKLATWVMMGGLAGCWHAALLLALLLALPWHASRSVGLCN